MEYDGTEYNPKYHTTVHDLSQRERWLVIEGFIAGYAKARRALPSTRVSELAAEWLANFVTENVTVAMALDHEAKRHSE